MRDPLIILSRRFRALREPNQLEGMGCMGEGLPVYSTEESRGSDTTMTLVVSRDRAFSRAPLTSDRDETLFAGLPKAYANLTNSELRRSNPM